MVTYLKYVGAPTFPRTMSSNEWRTQTARIVPLREKAKSRSLALLGMTREERLDEAGGGMTEEQGAARRGRRALHDKEEPKNRSSR